MKLFALPLLLSLTLAGCATSGSVLPGDASTKVANSIAATKATISEVQAIAKQVCAFIPTAQTVGNILSAFGVPGIGAAGNIASQICNAVTINPLADGPGARNYKPRVAGVRIYGKFVR